jgi:tetratricopeptide (TPR) repeat protein
MHEFQRKFGDICIDLARADGRLFVEQYLDSEPNRLSPGFRETLYRQTKGHPLFTVELLHGMQERGDLVQDSEGLWLEGPALDWETLPTRVEAVIAERIGRLDGPSQQAMRVASIEGETFTAEVVARVQSVDVGEIVACLSGELERRHRLIRAQEIQRLGLRRLSRYRFRHILFQNYLYHDLDPVECMHLHEAVGTALEALYGEDTAEIALALARHFQEAGIAEKAIMYLLQAGEKAKQGSANEAAIAHLTQGLELLLSHPSTPERAQWELGLQLALGVPLVLTKGHADPEVERVYGRAWELCEQVGDTDQRFQVLLGLRRYHLHCGELHKARQLGDQLLTLAQNEAGGALLSRAHMMYGETLHRMGEFAQAQTHYQRGLDLQPTQDQSSHMLIYGNDTRVLCQVLLALVQWHLGYPDQALKVGLDGLSRAQQLAHPFTLVCARYFVAVLRHLRREWNRAQEQLESLLQICQDRSFALYSAWGNMLLSRTLVEQGEPRGWVSQLERGLAAYQATRAMAFRPHFSALLADAYGKTDRAEDGLRAVTEGLTVVDKTDERTFEGELQRLKGELLLQNGQETEAEECLAHSLQIARGKSAKSWELRSATSLGRLWQKQGKRDKAQKLLQETYEWFTEGFDSADLIDAEALLDALE